MPLSILILHRCEHEFWLALSVLIFKNNVNLQYMEKNQHYDWHADQDSVGYHGQNGKYRKLSLSVQLSDPSEYEGGELEFMWLDSSKR